MTVDPLDTVPPAAWESLSARPVFFGHQSVGRNIMAGVQRVLADRPQIGLRIVNADGGALEYGPGFFEARIGRNREPGSKTDAFAQAIGNGFAGQDGAIAMHKYCYVDMRKDTDPAALFEQYSTRMTELAARFPGLTLIHFTIPLHTVPAGPGEVLKTALGAATETRLNAKREQYNELMRTHYRGAAPVFDLAEIESVRPDGSLAFSTYRRRRIPVLAHDWTDDGGHLNDAAQYRVAEQLLALLGGLSIAERQPITS